ncbi:hypothetical protein [Streptomyces synnematoformans]|uniref:DUF3168 domain-containing protein n=1 Tax=Streptomyces synnematoformans TaxID=415721 RepID=A0ABN2XCH4_9ACTN
MSPIDLWPDVEVELVALLGAALTGTRLCTELPADLLDVLPVLQVQRVPGGGDDGFRLDRALVDADAYAATRAGASQLARTARAVLLGLPGTTTTAAVFGRVRTVAAPAWRPYENPGLRRMGTTYELLFHPA